MITPIMRRRAYKKWIILAGIVCLSGADHLGWLTGPAGDDRARYHGVECVVTYVSDGDTIDVDLPDGRKATTRIRLWGVDCPEIAHDPEETGAYFGEIAKDFVQEHVHGRRVRLALDPNRDPRDKYGRLLSFVYLADSGEMLNELLVQEGLAYADRRFDHAYNLRFQTLEKRAAKKAVGQWADVSVEQMPAWRQRMLKVGTIR